MNFKRLTCDLAVDGIDRQVEQVHVVVVKWCGCVLNNIHRKTVSILSVCHNNSSLVLVILTQQKYQILF